MSNRARPTGRRPGTGDTTREEILSAARAEFAANGFKAATMRSIATSAGVNVALLAHYFGNKDGLFEATLSLPAGAADSLADAVRAGLDGSGEQLTRTYLSLWEEPASREQLMATVRSAMTDDRGVQRLHDQIVGAVEQALADTGDHLPPGLILALSQLLGVAIARHIAAMPVVSTLAFDELATRVARSVQSALDF